MLHVLTSCRFKRSKSSGDTGGLADGALRELSRLLSGALTGGSAAASAGGMLPLSLTVRWELRLKYIGSQLKLQNVFEAVEKA